MCNLGNSAVGVITDIQRTSFHNVIGIRLDDSRELHVLSSHRYEHDLGETVLVNYNKYVAYIWGEELS